MITGPHGQQLPDWLAQPVYDATAEPATTAVLGPGQPDSGPCYACGADADQRCARYCEANRAR